MVNYIKVKLILYEERENANVQSMTAYNNYYNIKRNGKMNTVAHLCIKSIIREYLRLIQEEQLGLTQ